jgi:hypothetical protein
VTEELRSGLGAEAIAAVRMAQEQASSDRAPTPGEHAPVVDNGDNLSPDADPYLPVPPRARDGEEPASPRSNGLPPQNRARGDHQRDEILGRFRDRREAEAIESADELDEIEAIKRAQAEAAPPDMVPPTETVRLTVRGRQIEVSAADLISLAQQSAAAKDYLRDARATFDHAKAESARIIEAAQAQARNLTPLSKEDLQAVVDEAAYGDPEQATTLLANKLSGASQQARERLEAERGQQALNQFLQENPQLGNDEMAMAAMETRLYAHFLEDLKRVGFPTDQLADNNAIATIHMRARADGKAVRGLKELFDASRDDYLAWKGGQRPPAPRPSQEPRQGAPRVEVRVNRDARRANIPTSAPNRNPQRNPAIMDEPQRTNLQARSDAARTMIEQRKALRNGGRR